MNGKTKQRFGMNANDNQPSATTQRLLETIQAAQTNLENVQDFSNVCRICATDTEFVIPIFEGEGLQNNLAEKIRKYLPITVTEQDVLPRVVCYQCASTLFAWHEMVNCCVQADAALKSRLPTPPSAQQDIKPSVSGSSQPVNTNQKTKPTKISPANQLDEDEAREDTKVELKILIDKHPRRLVSVGEDGKKYAKCKYCDKNIILSSWKRHIRRHEGEKRYSCPTCGLGFNDNGNLARHAKALHSKQRPHVCELCNKSFSRSSHLQDHVKSHSESRDFVCDVCGKASKSGAALRMHRSTHKECRFECMHCGARFKRRGELTAHVSVHTGEKAHLCGCGRAFRLRTQLSAHARTHRNQ